MYGVNVHDSMRFLNDSAAQVTQDRGRFPRILQANHGHSAPEMTENHSESPAGLPQICLRFAARRHNGEGQDAR